MENVTDRRQNWAFRYKPAEVLAAAKEKVKHHTEREQWWQAAYVKAEEELKRKGFEYRERMGTLEPQVQILGNPELVQRVTDCRRKITEHREKQKVYETWVRALKTRTERQPGEDLELSFNDVVFFGL